ncbi:MAG TPA: hypothetical protein VFV84_02345 [Burkholderiales bacterium]|nr:hypothetical protein [Burkholderiales bacterium]
MAESERDERVTQAYRALGDEAPPPALDAAILAASRRRSGRWHVPVAAAAALVLAVAVAVVVEREAPTGDATVALAPQVMTAPAPEVARKSAGVEPRLAESRAKAEDRAAVGQARRDELAKREARQSPQRLSAPAAPAAARESAQAGLREESRAAAAPSAAPAASRVAPPSAAGAVAETPEQWLERIAKLREAGRDQEADDSLAAFRRRYPDFVIPEKMRARIQRR